MKEYYTITFDEKVKGWTSFHSFYPDYMLRLSNEFYTIKDGQLWVHNQQVNGYNNFYGEQHKSEITTIFNDASSDDKIFKTIVLESTIAWSASIKTNYTESHIKKQEFNRRESRWFAYTRQNENTEDLNGVSQGIGNIIATNGLEIIINEIPYNVSIGDKLYQVIDGQPNFIGNIKKNIDNKITVDRFYNAPIGGSFCFSKKNSRVEGGQMRGYYLSVTLTDDTKDKNELFAVNSEVVKSYI